MEKLAKIKMGDEGIKGFTQKNSSRLRSVFPLHRNYAVDFQFLSNNIHLTVFLCSKYII